MAIVWLALALLNREVRVLAETFDSAFRLGFLPWGEALAAAAVAGLLGWLGAHLSVSKHLREIH
jgi:cell division protein FtsX